MKRVYYRYKPQRDNSEETNWSYLPDDILSNLLFDNSLFNLQTIGFEGIRESSQIKNPDLRKILEPSDIIEYIPYHTNISEVEVILGFKINTSIRKLFSEISVNDINVLNDLYPYDEIVLASYQSSTYIVIIPYDGILILNSYDSKLAVILENYGLTSS